MCHSAFICQSVAFLKMPIDFREILQGSPCYWEQLHFEGGLRLGVCAAFRFMLQKEESKD